jgi:hypothetical protein
MVSVGQRQSLIEAAACAHCRPRAHKHTRKYTSKHLCKRAVALATMNYRARVHQLERDVITRRHPAAASPTDGHRRMATAVCQGRGRVACQPMHMLWWIQCSMHSPFKFLLLRRRLTVIPPCRPWAQLLIAPALKRNSEEHNDDQRRQLHPPCVHHCCVIHIPYLANAMNRMHAVATRQFTRQFPLIRLTQFSCCVHLASPLQAVRMISTSQSRLRGRT